MQFDIFKIFFVSPVLRKKKSLILLVLFMSFLLLHAFGMLPIHKIDNALFLFALTASKTLALWYSENRFAVISYAQADGAVKNSSITFL